MIRPAVTVTAFSSPDTRFLPNLVRMIVIFMVVVLGEKGGGLILGSLKNCKHCFHFPFFDFMQHTGYNVG